MSKWVQVPVTIMRTYAVEIDDEETIDHALEYVEEEIMGDDFEIDQSNVVVGEDEQMNESIRRLADERLPL